MTFAPFAAGKMMIIRLFILTKQAQMTLASLRQEKNGKTENRLNRIPTQATPGAIPRPPFSYRNEGDGMAQFYCQSRLGEVRHLTPEGTLICIGVPVARTGDYEYLASEGQSPGIQPAPDGMIVSRREPDEVFSPEALASFEGKPVTLDHPPVNVTPENWKQYAVGHVQNVRRGEGENADKVVADLIISDEQAIRAVNVEGIREISCGYEAELEQLEPGVELQRRIRGNHVAIVSAGRAGHAVAIKDRKGDSTMAEGNNESVSLGLLEKLIAVLGIGKPAGTAPTVDTEPAGTDGGEVEALKAENEQLKAKIADLEAAAANQGEGDLTDDEVNEVIGPDEPAGAPEEGKTDSLSLIARAAILAPDMSAGKPDSAKGKIAVMRRALDRACDDPEKRQIVEGFAGKFDTVADLSDRAVLRAFSGASTMLR